jgi:hypothetical protein
MAKARDIAALAGLAGLAYAMRNKSKPNEDAGDQKTSSYTGDTKKVEAKDTKDTAETSTADEGYKSNVLKAITAPKAASNDKAGNQGVLGGSTPSPKPKPKLKPRGMTGAQNTALANANRGMGKAVTTAASDEGARLGNIKAAKDYNRGLEMEKQILNNMITNPPMKKGGMVKPKKMASGGMTASRRADGVASRGKTKCKMY